VFIERVDNGDPVARDHCAPHGAQKHRTLSLLTTCGIFHPGHPQFTPATDEAPAAPED
jgi:hypothetical protein